MNPRLRRSLKFAAWLCLLLIVALAARNVDLSGYPLTGREWRPLAEDGSPETYLNDKPYLTFYGDGTYRGRMGRDGCGNFYNGSYAVSGQQITIGWVGMTLMGCIVAPYEYGTDLPPYLHNLQAAHSYEVAGDTLVIYFGDSGALRFVAGDAPTTN